MPPKARGGARGGEDLTMAGRRESFASTPGVRSRMRLQKSRDTRPELAVRRLLHAQGFRYRVHARPIKGLRRQADIVFGPARVAVFIDGCFWHGCPEHGNPTPSVNAWYWPAKIAATKARDANTDEQLRAAGWEVVRAWEHSDAAEVAQEVAALVTARSVGRRQLRELPTVLRDPSRRGLTSFQGGN